MASNHHQCHHHPTPPTTTPSCYCHPTPTTTTCYCTTTHYSAPPPPDPLIHSISSHHHHHHPPPQTHLQAPSQNHHNYHPPSPPHQIQQKHQLYQKYHQQENVQENLTPLNPTVSSLIHRITALESTLRRRSNQSPRSSTLRDTAARTIQAHFRAFLVRRSVTLRHLKDLAYIKSALNHLKSSVSNKSHFDSYFVSLESMNLLIKLDSIQGNDPMIRNGKRSISRELIRFMELIDQISKDSQVISVKNVSFSKVRPCGSRVFGENERKLAENLKKRINKIRVSSIPKTEEDEVESLEIEIPRKPGVSKNRFGGLTKSQRVVKSLPKVKKTVSFDDKGNVYRLIKSNHSLVLSDGSDSSNGDDEESVEIGVSSKETGAIEGEEEDSPEMSENEMDPRKNLSSRIHHTTQKNQPDQEVDDDDDDDDDDKEDSFVFSAPLPAKMEYRVDSVNKKQTGKH